MVPPPPRAVVATFGVDDEPVALEGGEGVAFRAGDIVLKRVHDPAEAEWTQGLVATVEQDGFRVANPVPTIGGRWVCDGWVASEFIAGLQPAAPRWNDVVAWGLRFGDAAERARRTHGELPRRAHRWAVADRAAWGEARVPLSPEVRQVRDALLALVVPRRQREQHFVHGDLAGNVFVDRSGVPVILDVAPYLRPRRWAAAVVVADAVLWYRADMSLAGEFAGTAEGRDLIGRALIFRLVADQLAGKRRHDRFLDPYRRVRAALE